jgi:hypothetical protein
MNWFLSLYQHNRYQVKHKDGGEMLQRGEMCYTLLQGGQRVETKVE